MSNNKVSEQYTHEIVGECLREYGNYVMHDRTLPDVRDGLKPAQRRLLWAMYKLGVKSSKTSVKAARVVGDTIGSYHPHGDASTYDTLVRLTHLPYPLVHGDGNFGQPDVLWEKSAAAYRYTECRLSSFGDTCFDEIHVADMVPNYDETTEEPRWLPTQAPWVLINGTTGIGVGNAAKVPPHNLGEVLHAAVHLLDNPDCTTEDLLEHIKGPDYGTGVLLSKKSELLDLYETGRGKLSFRSTYVVEEYKHDQNKLVITGLAPDIKKKKVCSTAEELARKKLIESPVTDESTIDKKSGTFNYRDTITYRNPQIVRDRLLPLLDSSVSYQWLLLSPDGHPQWYTLLGVLRTFLDFRREVETRVLQERQEKLQRRLGVMVAKYRAAQQPRVVARIIEQAESDQDAIQQLQEQLKLKHVWQAEAILEAPLRSLMRLRAAELKQQGQKLKAELADVETQLADVDSVVRAQLLRMAALSCPRGTRLRGRSKDFGEDQHYWIGVTQTGKVDLSLDLPLKSRAVWGYQDFFASTGPFVVVHDTNEAQAIHVSYLDRYDPVGRVVGATGLPRCIVITEKGNYVAFDLQQRRSQFPCMRGLAEDMLVAALGFADDGFVVVQQQDGGLLWLPVDEVKVTRPNVKPRRLKTTASVLRAWFQAEQTQLIDARGVELGKPDFVETDEVLYLVGAANLVVFNTGVRKTVGRVETTKQIAAKAVAHVVPL